MLLSASLICAVCAAGCSRQGSPDEISARERAPCSAEGTPFAETPFATYNQTLEAKYQWHDIFENQVKAVVDAHTRQLLQSQEEGTPNTLDCSAENYRSMFRANPALIALASQLPEFRDRVGQLSEMDIGVVLQEWLRVYQCALNEENIFAEPNIEKSLIDAGVKDLSFGQVSLKALEQKSYTESELRRSDALMGRVLTLVGGFGRLRPLYAELTCLERATADIRNNLSLLAEASVCLPRAMNARSTLRDFRLGDE